MPNLSVTETSVPPFLAALLFPRYRRESERCVVSLGINSPSPAGFPVVEFQDYSLGLRRIRQTLQTMGTETDYFAWDQSYPKGSPTHREAPWGYKPYCLAAARRRGYRTLLWMDASVKIIAPIEPLFERVEQDGYLAFNGSHSVGEYCKDEALATLGITREESFTIPSCRCDVLGLSLDHPACGKFLDEWRRFAADGITFPGPKWSGARGWPVTASTDPRVKGHRHDQTAASTLLYQLGLTKWQTVSFYKKFFVCDREYVRSYVPR